MLQWCRGRSQLEPRGHRWGRVAFVCFCDLLPLLPPGCWFWCAQFFPAIPRFLYVSQLFSKISAFSPAFLFVCFPFFSQFLAVFPSLPHFSQFFLVLKPLFSLSSLFPSSVFPHRRPRSEAKKRKWQEELSEESGEGAEKITCLGAEEKAPAGRERLIIGIHMCMCFALILKVFHFDVFFVF